MENWKQVEESVSQKEAEKRANRATPSLDLPEELKSYITETITNDVELSNEESSLADLRMQNVKTAARTFHLFDSRLEKLKGDKLKFEEKFLITSAKNRPPQVIEAMKKIDSEIEETNKSIDELMQSNPEAYVVRNALELRNYRKQLRFEDFVLTPYAEKKLDELQDNYYAVDKVPFLNGETGSGKSSIAKYFCSDVLGTDPERIAGAKGIDETKIFGKIDLSSDEKGPQAVFIPGPLYRAMENGTPLIIEEVNAIPPEILKSLNDIIINAKKGEEVPVIGDPKGIKIKAKDGFGVIMTGNLNRNPKAIDRYKGLFELSADFINRIRPIDYDYLPQSTEGNYHEGAGKGNELFTLMVAMVMDDKGDINAPKEAFDDLWRFAKFTRKVQEVYSGQRDGKLFSSQGGLNVPVAATSSVVSMRDIKQVVESWKRDNFENEFDYYIYKELIAPLTNVMDTKFFVQQLQAEGFFADASWKDVIAKAGTFDSAIHAPENKGKDIEFLTVRNVVENVYGKAPERKEVPYDLNIGKRFTYEISDAEITINRFSDLTKDLNKYQDHDLTFLDKPLAEVKSFVDDLKELEAEFVAISSSGSTEGMAKLSRKLSEHLDTRKDLALLKMYESDVQFRKENKVSTGIMEMISIEKDLFRNIELTYTPEFVIDEDFVKIHRGIIDEIEKTDELLKKTGREGAIPDSLFQERRLLNLRILAMDRESAEYVLVEAKLGEIDQCISQFKNIKLIDEVKGGTPGSNLTPTPSDCNLYPKLRGQSFIRGATTAFVFNVDVIKEEGPKYVELIEKTKIEINVAEREIFEKSKNLFKNKEVVHLQRFYEKSFYTGGAEKLENFTFSIDRISKELSGFIYSEPWMILGFIYNQEYWMCRAEGGPLDELKNVFKDPVYFCVKEVDGTDILIKVTRKGDFDWEISRVTDKTISAAQFIAPQIVNPIETKVEK